MNPKKKISAIAVACVVVAAAVGVPIAFCDDKDAATSVKVRGIAPVVESITISPDDDAVTGGVQIDPNPFDSGSKTVTIIALVYCANGVGQVDTVSATIDPDITDVAEPITMAQLGGNPRAHRKNYQGTFALPPCQAAGDYTVTVTATHKKDGVADGTNTADFTVTQLMAMSTSGVIFDVGEETAPGDVATGTATVKCQGNVAIEFADVGKITWTGLTSVENPEHVIPLTSIALKTSTYTWGTAIACGLTDDIGFDLTIPMGTAAETYTGTITFTPSAVPS